MKSGGHAQAARHDQGHIARAVTVEKRSRTRQRRDAGDRDVVAEDGGCGAGPAAAAIQDDVVRRRVERELQIVLDAIGAELEPDRDPAGQFADPVRETAEVVRRREVVGERRGADGRCALREVAHRGNLPDDLRRRQVPGGAGLGALAHP